MLTHPNPSSTVQVSFSYAGVHVGQMTATDLTLTPGKNFILMAGILDPHSSDLGTVATFFSAYLRGEPSVVNVQGLGAATGAPDWLDRAVKDIDTTTTFTGYASPDTLLGHISIEKMGMTLDEDGNPLMS